MNELNANRKRNQEGMGSSSGSELSRKSWIALALYGVLAVLVWTTMDAGRVWIHGRPVELRLLPLVILGGLALRTVLALKADKIRRGGSGGGGSTP